MARKPKKRDTHRVKVLLEGMISEAKSYDGSDRQARRERALDYQAGFMPDLVAEDGKSAVVEQILADTMSMLQPNLMRVFLSSDKIAIYDPVPPRYAPGMPQDEFRAECQRVEAFADQATDYVNFVFLKECSGEKLIRDAIYDGLLHGNGIVKHWWDPSPQHETESYSGLTDDEFGELVADDDVEVLEHSEKPAEGVEVGSIQDDDEAARAEAGGGGGANAASMGAGMAGPAPQGAGGPLGTSPQSGLPVSAPPQPSMPGQAAPPGPMAGAVMGMAPQGSSQNGDGSVPQQPTTVLGGSGHAPMGSGLPGAAGPQGIDLSALIDSIPGIGDNFPPPSMLHDVKIRRVISKGRLRVKALPSEDFLIENGATALNEDECRFAAHRETPTRSDLVERGYDQDIVWSLPSITENTEESTRNEQRWSGSDSYEDKAGERVELYECYALLDPAEDGHAEWFQVIIGGNGGSSELLEMTEWGGRLPFSDIVPDPVPHRWLGRSLYDRLRDPQRVATAFSRRMNDNLYLTVEPQRAVDMSKIENPDALFDVRLGSHLRVKGDPRAAVMDLTVPFVAKEAQPLIEEQRRIAERRTGVGEQSQGLDANALSGQVATAVAATQSAASLRKEDYARNIAYGFKRVFASLLRLMVENQDRERMIHLRKQWVPMNPQAWSAEMDVTINIGLGAGNRDRDLAMLQGIAGKQEQILQVLGPDNPLLGIKEYFTTLQMMVEAAGVKSPERFFPDPSDAILGQMRQAAAQKAQQPDPKTAAAQAQLQITQAKAQADAQLNQQKAQADAQLQNAKAQADGQMNAAKMQQQQQLAEAKLQADMRVREAEMQHRMEMDRVKAQQDLQAAQQKAQIELQVAQAKADAQLQIMREKAQADLHIRTVELQLEATLKQQQMAANINPQNATDLEMPR